jgi:succinyl-diaminopimelate desuccinylase
VELHFTYDEEFGGEVGPGWLLSKGLTKPDLMIAAGFSYQVVVAHNGCLQMEVTVHGEMATPPSPTAAPTRCRAPRAHPERAVRPERATTSRSLQRQGITHPYLNVGLISGGTNTNVIPGKVVLKLDRRMIPEEDPAEVEAVLRAPSIEAAASFNPPRGGKVRPRGHQAHAAGPRHGAAARQRAAGGNAIQQHGEAVFGEPIPPWARRCTPTCACMWSAASPA